MFDHDTREGRFLAAALECAAKKSWAEVSLLDIAEGANLPLSELRGAFTTKSDIIAALLRAIDDEVLKRAAKRGEGQEKRDLLFDIIMTRFDVLGPYKVRINLSAEVAVESAHIQVNLPEGLVFWAGGQELPQRSFEWTQPLRAGDNDIPIAVRGTRPGRYRMTLSARIGSQRVEDEVVLEVIDG